MAEFYDANAPKRAVNLSVNSDLLRQAKELNINLSACVESELAKLVTAERRRLTEASMREAAEIWAKFREEHGSAIDEFRDL